MSFFLNENQTMQFIYNIDLNVQKEKGREEKGIQHSNRSGTIFEANSNEIVSSKISKSLTSPPFDLDVSKYVTINLK